MLRKAVLKLIRDTAKGRGIKQAIQREEGNMLKFHGGRYLMMDGNQFVLKNLEKEISQDISLDVTKNEGPQTQRIFKEFMDDVFGYGLIVKQTKEDEK